MFNHNALVHRPCLTWRFYPLYQRWLKDLHLQQKIDFTWTLLQDSTFNRPPRFVPPFSDLWKVPRQRKSWLEALYDSWRLWKISSMSGKMLIHQFWFYQRDSNRCKIRWILFWFIAVDGRYGFSSSCSSSFFKDFNYDSFFCSCCCCCCRCRCCRCRCCCCCCCCCCCGGRLRRSSSSSSAAFSSSLTRGKNTVVAYRYSQTDTKRIELLPFLVWGSLRPYWARQRVLTSKWLRLGALAPGGG